MMRYSTAPGAARWVRPSVTLWVCPWNSAPEPRDGLVREMTPGRLPAGTFTDDTEMALALADSLLAHCPLDPEDLAQRFVVWLRAGPPDVGLHTRDVLSRISAGEPWDQAVDTMRRRKPDSASNGSVMRCWPVTLTHWDDLERLLVDSGLQSRVTHSHPECVAGSMWVNAAVFHLLREVPPREVVARALDDVKMPAPLAAVIQSAPAHRREELINSGWVHHTLESAVWGLLATDSFEEAVVQVVNLGNHADTAGAVVGALAGAAYGMAGIPARWCEALRGEWPLSSGSLWRTADLVALADQLVSIESDYSFCGQP